MNYPKMVRYGDFFHAGRGTRDGMYLLAPRPRTEKLARFHVARAAELSGVVLTSVMMMSNHHHTTGTDLRADRGAFHCAFHGGLGTELKQDHSLEHGVWDRDERTHDPVVLNSAFVPSEPPPADADDWDLHVAEALETLFQRLGVGTQARTVLYGLFNPLKANLVSKLKNYPNAWFGPHHWGRFVTVPAPSGQFKNWGKTATMVMLPPPEEWDEAGWSRTESGILLPRKPEVIALDRRIRRAREEYEAGDRKKPRPTHWEGIISRERLEEVRRRYDDYIAEGEAFFRELRHKRGKKAFGAAALVKQKVLDSPDRSVTSLLEIEGIEAVPGLSEKRRQELADTIVMTRKKRRRKPSSTRQQFVGNPDDVATAMAGLVTWRRNHREARKRWAAARDFSVVFPYGTYNLRRYANVRCRGRPLIAETRAV